MNQRKELTEFLANLSKGDFANAQTSLSLAIEGKVKERMAAIMKEDKKENLKESVNRKFAQVIETNPNGSDVLVKLSVPFNGHDVVRIIPTTPTSNQRAIVYTKDASQILFNKSDSINYVDVLKDIGYSINNPQKRKRPSNSFVATVRPEYESPKRKLKNYSDEKGFY